MIRNLLVLPTGEELFSGAVEENAISGVKLTQCVNTQDELCPGAVCASMLEASVIVQKPLSLNAGDEVVLYTVSDSGKRQQEGIFIAEKPVWESAHRYTLTAYDRVSRLDKDLTSWLAELTGWPYYLLDFAHMVCTQCGVELLNEEIPNGEYPVQAFSAEGITGRQLMQWIGQAAGRFCRATTDGRLEFAWYQETGKAVGPGEKIIQAGPAKTVVLDGLQEGEQLQVISEVNPNFTGKKSIKLTQTGRNILDLQSNGVYHSNAVGSTRHKLTITDTGIRIDVTNGLSYADNSIWGFCIGTAEELAGKTLTLSADFTTSLTGQAAKPFLGFYEADVDPVYTPRENFSGYMGGCLISAPYSALSYRFGEGVRDVTYTVTGKETQKYIAVLFRMSHSSRITTKPGDWTQWDNIQVEYNDTATPYQPYYYEEFTRSFSAVYGGSLNWNTGELTVTYDKILSYAGEEVPDGWTSNTGSLTTGAQVVYPLEKPRVIRLEPQQIKALDGRNFLWSSTGNTTAGFHQDHYYRDTLQFEDYAVTPIEKVQIRLTEADVGAVYPDDPEKTNAYILSGNYLLTNADAEALESVAQVLYEEIKDISYTPCRLEVPASAGIKAGDVVTVTDRNGRQITVYVMDRSVSGQRCTLSCSGSPRRDSTTAVNRQTYQALSGKVLELRTDIEGLRLQHRDAQGDHASLAVTVEGIAAEVSRQKSSEENILKQLTDIQQTAEAVSIQVQSLHDQGADKIKTAMGYTFDDTGLRISRTDAPVSNLLDHTGMYVECDGQTVLQANDDGVEAVNITVRSYLTVGNHSRFETYNNGRSAQRTACFFRGGE